MGSAALSEAIKSIRDWSLTDGRVSTTSTEKAADVFGSRVFNDKVQQERLPKPAYRALRATITRGEPLEVATADAVALALKEWAVEHGASHYTHWFQPLTGITAEKHDSFLGPNADGTAMAAAISGNRRPTCSRRSATISRRRAGRRVRRGDARSPSRRR